MSRECSVCAHPEREAIDLELARARTNRDIARKWGVTKSSVHRHRQDHVPPRVVDRARTETIGRAEDILRELHELQVVARSILSKASTAGDLRAATGAIAQVRSNLELIARLLGELKEGPSVNLIVSPEWGSLRAAILEALVPFPEARTAVVKALLRREGASGMLPTGPSATVRTLPDASGVPALPAPIEVMAADSDSSEKDSPLRDAGQGAA